MKGICSKPFALFFLVLSIAFSACVNNSFSPARSEKTYPLHAAVRSDNAAQVLELLAKGTEIDGADEFGMTPLGIAVERQIPAMVSLLLGKGANVRKPSGEYGTVLHLAVLGRSSNEEPNLEIADLLISRGADLEAVSPVSGFTPIHQAAAWDRVNIADLLLRRGAMVNSRPDARGFPGVTPLHVAVDGSHKMADKMVKLLLEHGANVQIRTRFDGATPLLASLTNSPANADVVKLLLDHGADVNARLSPSIAEYKQYDGDTALHRAVVHREVKITEILLSRGADVNAKTTKGMTPLALARYWEKRSGNWENQAATKEYRDIYEILRRHGGHE